MKNILQKLRRATPAEKARRRFEEPLQKLAADPAGIGATMGLVQALRPRRPRDLEDAERRLTALTQLIQENDAHRSALRRCVLLMLAGKQAVRLYTDSGLLEHEGLFSGLWRRLAQTVLPEVLDRNRLKDVLGLLFQDSRDYLWVGALPEENWQALLRALELDTAEAAPEHRRIAPQLLDALQVISYRITAIGLEPELVRNHPQSERHDSSFMLQNVATIAFTDHCRSALAGNRPLAADSRDIAVLLDQCEDIVQKIRQQASQTGASVSLTYHLVRLRQHIARFRALLQLLQLDAVARNAAAVRLYRELVLAENRRNSLGDLWSQSMELIATRITDNAGKKGEHYITHDRAGYFQMLRSALGAGFVVGFMAMVKINLGQSPHSPMAGAFLYSMNYALGFVLIYLLGFTIATKQPAMTASHIAASLQHHAGSGDRLDGLADLIVRMVRSQFIAIVGNVAFGFTIPILLAYFVYARSGQHYVSHEQAQHLLELQNPIAGLALFHAAIAGVCLFLAGLISGYFDNKAVYARIPQRIRQLRWLRRMLGRKGVLRFANYVENNLGGLAGNFFFGCMLGSMGTLGFILGLPLDIRHITFSSAFSGYALVALDWQPGLQLGLLVLLGVVAIGLTNLTVSFTLALYVALKAQRVQFSETRPLLGKLARRFRAAPRDFFLPPREQPQPSTAAQADTRVETTAAAPGAGAS